MKYMPANKICEIPADTLGKLAKATYNRIDLYDEDNVRIIEQKIRSHQRKYNFFPLVLLMDKKQLSLIDECKEAKELVRNNILILGIKE